MGEGTPIPHSEGRVRKEHREIPQEMRAWLGGAFEAGGSIIFSTDSSHGGHTYPDMSLGDNSAVLAFRLFEELGGNEPRQDLPEKTWIWRIRGYKAANIVTQMEGFAPSRGPVIHAVRQWEEAETAERLRIAAQFKVDRPSHPSLAAEDYKDLVENPSFLAGLVDSRGVIYSEGRKNFVFQLNTLNLALIDALIVRYGGTKAVQPKSGTISIIHGKSYLRKHDVQHWELGETDTRKFAGIVRPYLLTGRIKGEQALRG